ncbi:nucleoside monophosphate kinase [Flavobacterium sp. LM4]|uniref:adenylate kinase family protein n=1 Tax=Flavobacterium sp. LM4 TaxID=1938609 RepID=UPI000991EFE1|nr:nucleoside monophosphate kinase [Flavobacterium sp. LM4]OOV19080.1 adenylate kinase [Flavobacterium sp. LM4]
MEILIITGPPYSGKGTQCEILKKELKFEHISTGDRCRLEKQNETEIGRIMCEYEEKGDLVPDSIMKNLFSKILDENISNKGIILDGYPRTNAQVNDLLELIESKDLKIGKVININVPKLELLKRAKKRAETSDRKDDKDAEIHIKRIEVFEDSTRPAIEYMKYKLNVLTFDGLGTIDEITNRVKASL